MKKKVLAVASGGGHWTQMMRLRRTFDGHDVVFVGVKEMYRNDVAPYRFYAIHDVSRLQKWSIFYSVAKLIFILLKEKPAVVVTTGSAPGMLALRLGKMLGARTVWIDSIANVEQMSLSGQKARRYADLWLTQWAHLACENGPRYVGSVL
jgi:UDP-N-acetylglucosamine:LPS N-acetylglucosamine transferase